MVKHFEALFYIGLWANAAALAAIVGRPWLGLIGVVTVLPFVVAYARSPAGRRRAPARSPRTRLRRAK